MAMKPEIDRYTEEMLEWLRTREEDGETASLEELLKALEIPRETWAKADLENRGFVVLDKNGVIRMTEKGRQLGRTIIRRHRLAERLLADILHVKDTETAACRFEHAIDQDIAEHICTLLGHPTTCPHGKPIPPGNCCIHKDNVTPSAIKSIADLLPGETGRIAYIASTDDSVLHRLAALGIVPEAEISLHQDHPGIVLSVGNTRVALDRETVKDIYVKVNQGPGLQPPHRHRRGWRFWQRRGGG